MLGAIIGDIAGSRFEWSNIKSKEFDLFTNKCRPTDDSIMTLAIAKAILSCDAIDISQAAEEAIICMQELGNLYPRAGYGGSFRQWHAGLSAALRKLWKWCCYACQPVCLCG